MKRPSLPRLAWMWLVLAAVNVGLGVAAVAIGDWTRVIDSVATVALMALLAFMCTQVDRLAKERDLLRRRLSKAITFTGWDR